MCAAAPYIYYAATAAIICHIAGAAAPVSPQGTALPNPQE